MGHFSLGDLAAELGTIYKENIANIQKNSVIFSVRLFVTCTVGA